MCIELHFCDALANRIKIPLKVPDPIVKYRNTAAIRSETDEVQATT
jgi:translation elongation factor EF-G